MTTQEILQHWLDYTKYDPNQKSFNLLSSNYAFYRASKAMSAVMEFDPTGTIAVLYAKEVFLQICKEQSVSLFDLLSGEIPELKDGKTMWDIFMSDDFSVVEKQFLDAIDSLTSKVVGVKPIGERDLEKERAALFDSIVSVTEELTICKTSLYLKGGPIQPIKNFSTSIHVFERLADCLLALEQAPDGVYLCYITSGGTADGYFGFYIKSNGTILSLSERIDEAFPGQHRNSRNGRWSEEKKYNLFPYNFMFSFSEHDYLGYAKNHIIDDSQLAFCNLEPEAYMPIILAMVMIANKFAEADISKMPVMLVDSLFQRNLETALPESKALVIPSDSALAAVSRNYVPEMTTEDILGTDMAKKLTDPSRLYYERGSFETTENIFVKLYGKGFELDASKLLVSDPHLKMLTAEERRANPDLIPNAEFIGSADRMEVIAYMQGRQQLAEYIRKQMFQEYIGAGGAEGIEKWWRNALQERKDEIFSLCIRKYLKENEPGLEYIRFGENSRGPYYGSMGAVNPYNEWKRTKEGRRTNDLLCPVTGAATSIAFLIQPDNWLELQELFGEIPKILKGWTRHGHNRRGNSLLDATDPVFDVGTPFENREQQLNHRYWSEWDWMRNREKRPEGWHAQECRPQTDFSFGVAFSKRGLARLIRKQSILEASRREGYSKKNSGGA